MEVSRFLQQILDGGLISDDYPVKIADMFETTRKCQSDCGLQG